MKKGFKYYILALGCMIFVSCIHDKIDIIPATKSHEVEFYLQTIATTKPTRAITSVDENHISNLHLLAFDAAGGYLYAKSATSISSSNADGSLKRAKFIVDDDDINENIQLVFIANVPDVQSIINSLTVGTSIDLIQPLFVFDNWSESDTESSSSFTPMPMWGKTTTPTLSAGATGITVKMIRALARVNVTLGGGNGLTNVTIKSVSLYNYRTKGYLWPALSNYSNENDQAIAPTFSESVTPISNVALTYNALSQNALLGSVYLTETDNNISNRLCIVIGLSIENGDTEYFRLDFIDSDKDYVSVLRNHSYNFNVTRVADLDGYSTIIEAINSNGENISYTLNVVDNSNHNIMITDEQNILCMDFDKFYYTLDGGSQDWIVYTDASGWEIDVDSFKVNGSAMGSKPSDVNITTKGTTNAAYTGLNDINYYLTISVGSSASDRTICFNIVAGDRIYKTITIYQM